MSRASAGSGIDLAVDEPAAAAAAARLTPEQREHLREFWLARADGELTTALSFEYILSDLQRLRAPDTLTELAERAIAEEHRHVDWCLRFAKAFSDGKPANAAFRGTRPVDFDGASERDNLVLRTVFGGCFSETVAVHVLLSSQAGLELESVQRVNRRHIAEEVRHSRLGWGLLAWPGLDARDREMVSEFVPELARLTRQVWCDSNREADPQLHALGYLSQPLVRQACQQAFDVVIYPGLLRNGIRIDA